MALSSQEQTDLQLRITIARGHLRNNEVKQAMTVYATCILDYPEEIEAYLVLGDLQLAGEKPSLAMSCYQAAAFKFPQRIEIEKRIQLTISEYGQIAGLTPDQFTKWLKSLVNSENEISAEALSEANKLMQEIIHSQEPADLVAKNLDRIEELLPAFLELNIQQARAENRTDIQMGLEQIKKTIMAAKPDESDLIFANIFNHKDASFPKNIQILVSDEEALSSRVKLMKEVFSRLGINVTVKSTDSQADAEITPDLVVASNPHVNPWLLEQMARYTASRIPIILDLDLDYEQMPINHPQYMEKGLGLPANARAYTAAMVLAGMITTSSERFANHLIQTGYRALVVPEGWSRKNPLWEKPAPKRPTIHIGWVGCTGTIDDIIEIRRILIRVIREFPKTQLIISDNSKAFQLFDSLPENRKLFLPEVEMEDHPYIFNQIDILVVPLRNIPFNYSLPDSPFLYAGIKHIPWVASKISSSLEWNSGGLISSSIEEWHTNLRQLVMDADLRNKLGEAGYTKAMSREVEGIIPYWRRALLEIMQNPWAAGSSTAKENNRLHKVVE